MTDIDNFAKRLPGAEEGALLALVLFNDLLGLLRERGILSAHDVAGLLTAASVKLGQSRNALAKRGVGFIENAIRPEQKFI